MCLKFIGTGQLIRHYVHEWFLVCTFSAGHQWALLSWTVQMLMNLINEPYTHDRNFFTFVDFFLHLRFQNSRKCTFDFKISVKKGYKCKKRQKIHFQFRNSYKKISKREKRKHIYLDFVRFYIPCAFFCILNLKIHIKKDKKKHKNFFKLQK